MTYPLAYCRYYLLFYQLWPTHFIQITQYLPQNKTFVILFAKHYLLLAILPFPHNIPFFLSATLSLVFSPLSRVQDRFSNLQHSSITLANPTSPCNPNKHAPSPIFYDYIIYAVIIARQELKISPGQLKKAPIEIFEVSSLRANCRSIAMLAVFVLLSLSLLLRVKSREAGVTTSLSVKFND